jgi:hypothetical protein
MNPSTSPWGADLQAGQDCGRRTVALRDLRQLLLLHILDEGGQSAERRNCCGRLLRPRPATYPPRSWL